MGQEGKEWKMAELERIFPFLKDPMGILTRSLKFCLFLKGTLHSVEKNPYTEGLLCLLLHSERTAIFLCRLTA